MDVAHTAARTCPERPGGVGSERPMESPRNARQSDTGRTRGAPGGAGSRRAVPAVPRRRRPPADRRARRGRPSRSRSAAATRPTSRCRGTRRRRACTPSSRCRAGEWTICDDGWSQNGTWVNGLRLAGRRRLADGDLVKIGRTIIGFHAAGHDRPRADDGRRASSAPRRASPSSSSGSCARSAGRCSPTATASTRPATSRSPTTTGIDVDVVTQELDLLARLFGLEDMPRPERRAEVALLAVRSGLVGADEGGTQG